MVEIGLVPLEYHVLHFDLLDSFYFDSFAAWQEDFSLSWIGRVLFSVEAEAWVTDLVEHVEDEKNGALEHRGTLCSA